MIIRGNISSLMRKPVLQSDVSPAARNPDSTVEPERPLDTGALRPLASEVTADVATLPAPVVDAAAEQQFESRKREAEGVGIHDAVELVPGATLLLGPFYARKQDDGTVVLGRRGASEEGAKVTWLASEIDSGGSKLLVYAVVDHSAPDVKVQSSDPGESDTVRPPHTSAETSAAIPDTHAAAPTVTASRVDEAADPSVT